MKIVYLLRVLLLFLVPCGYPSLCADEGRASTGNASGNVKKSTAKVPYMELAVIYALQYLNSEQKPDGSWRGKDSITTTAMVYAAFIWNNTPRESERFGDVVRKAEEWLAKSTPETLEEKAALYLAALLHVASSDVVPELKRIADDFPLSNNELEKLSKTWQVWLAMARFPDSSSKPTFLVDNYERLQSGFASKQPRGENSKSEIDYLHLYAVTLAKFMGGLNSWDRHDYWMAEFLLPLQDEKGAFPETRDRSSVANTALAALSMQVYYAYNGRFLDYRVTGRRVRENIFKTEENGNK
jgi:hypothetical protein